MARPSGIAVRTCTIGVGFGQESNADLGASITAKSSEPELVWAATGSPGVSDPVTITIEPGAEASFDLIPTDLTGWLKNGAPVDVTDGKQSHYYTITVQWQKTDSFGRPKPVGPATVYSRTPIPSGDDPLDLDTVVQWTGATGQTISLPAELTTAVTDAQTYAAQAATSAQQAHDLSQIDTSDGVVAAQVADDGSATTAELKAAVAGYISDPNPDPATNPVPGALDTVIDANTTAPDPRKVIVSTDWYTDCDDVGAMRVLAKCERAGLVDVLAVVVDTAAANSAPSLDGFLRDEFGRQVQIGQIDGFSTDLKAGGPYQAGLLSLPHYGSSGTAFPKAVTVLRTALAATEDASVDLISIGYLNAWSKLLDSPADTISALTGAQLIAAKVRHFWVMGGAYPGGNENNFSRSASTIAAAYNVVTNWPAPTGWTTADAPYITFLGYHVGQPVISGGNLAASVPTSDPMYAAYVAHGSGAGRSSWDPMTALLASLGDLTEAGYTSVRGNNVVNSSTGDNALVTSSTGEHRYVVKAQTDAWYVAQLNELYIPGRVPTWLNPDGNKFADHRPGAAMPLVAGNTDLGIPIEALRASDLALEDGATVASVAAVGATTTAWTAQAGNEPTFAASKGGKKAIAFAGNQWLSSVATHDRGQSTFTIYAKVWFDTLPAANQTIVSRDAATGVRGEHLKVIAGGIGQAVAWDAGTARTDTTGADLTTGAWHTLVLRKDDGSLEAFLDGVSNGAFTGSVIPTSGALPYRLGVSYLTGSGPYTGNEKLNGWLAEVRIFDVRHDDDQVVSYLADLA